MASIAAFDERSSVDPDAQAAVTDFLDYTEHLPSDLIRSLTLIRGLDEKYLTNSYSVHELTKQYGALPSMASASRPNPQDLRYKISSHLDHALNARESAYAEACRLFDVAERHQNRLKSIIAKLNALPKPPSRDPTPQPPTSTQTKRSRSGRKLSNGMSAQRLSLNPPRGNVIASTILNRPRGGHRRVTVPGEVMPPWDPDEAIASTEVSDLEPTPPPPTLPRLPLLVLKQPKPPKEVLSEVEREKKARAPREIATYRKPTPPPEDAEVGSKYRPWTYLTEYEMYKLRKKMKKNHTWQPSEVMIDRELADKGRGWENYYKAKAEAKANGTQFIDVGQEDRINAQTKELVLPTKKIEHTEIPPPTPVAATPKPFVVKEKPVKRPEPKKETKDDAASLAAREAEQAARRLGDIGSAFKNLFSPFSSALASLNRSASSPSIPTNSSFNAVKKSTADKATKKRKADEAGLSASPPASTEPDTQKKKQKLAPKPSLLGSSEPPSVIPVASTAPIPTSSPAPVTSSNTMPARTSAGTIKIPLKLNIAPPSTSESEASTPVSSAVIRPTESLVAVTTKVESSPGPVSRPPSRRSLAASAEPLGNPSMRSSRRTSTTPAAALRKTPVQETTPKSVATAASRRSKREAPGTVTQSGQDGGAAVSVSKRKTKPAKQNKKQTATEELAAPRIRIDVDGRQEIVNPDEEVYCICHDVSWGEMICCELDEKCEYGQWFHMDCVQLPELPPRTMKWYCPEDRKKHHRGEHTNGLVGRGMK